MDVVMLDENEKEVLLDQEKLSSKFGSAHYWGLMYRILSERELSTMTKKVSALLKVGARYEPSINKVKTIKLYRNLYSTLPEDLGKDPIEKKLILTTTIKK